MKQTTKRFLSMILSILLIGGAFIVFFDFIEPTYKDLQEVRSQQLSRQEFLNNQKSAVQQVQALIKDYQGQRGLQQQVSYVLPLNYDIAGALVQLNGLALSNRLRPDTFAVNGPTLLNTGADAQQAAGDVLIKPVGSIDFQIRFTSGYEDFKGFLEQLETNLRLFDVKSITLTPSVRPGIYAFDLTVTTYYQIL